MTSEKTPGWGSYEEIDRDLDAFRKIIDEKADRDMPIPDFLYHVTNKSKVRKILQEGLQPSELLDSRFDPAVSLSDDIGFAKNVVSITQNIGERSMVTLKIDTRYLSPNRTRNYLRRQDPNNLDMVEGAARHEVHYEADIPPEAIEVVRE